MYPAGVGLAEGEEAKVALPAGEGPAVSQTSLVPRRDAGNGKH